MRSIYGKKKVGPRVPLVLDANVIASWFFNDESQGRFHLILGSINKVQIHVPSIFQFEFTNILLNARKRGRIDQSSIYNILQIVSDYPIIIESSTLDFNENLRLINLAQQHGLTAYDTAYLDLAVRLDLPLITYDPVLLNIAKKLKLKTVFE